MNPKLIHRWLGSYVAVSHNLIERFAADSSDSIVVKRLVVQLLGSFIIMASYAWRWRYDEEIALFPVTERSEDTGLVYSLSVAWWAENYKFSTKGCFYFKEQRAIAEKLILSISCKEKKNKKKLSRQIKKCMKKSL